MDVAALLRGEDEIPPVAPPGPGNLPPPVLPVSLLLEDLDRPRIEGSVRGRSAFVPLRIAWPSTTESACRTASSPRSVSTSSRWTDPVLYELTAGARSSERARELRGLLLRGPMHPVVGLQDWEDAAHLYRAARSRGLTVRSSIDCLITAVALRTDTSLLALDRDFGSLAQVSDLDLVAP